MRQQSGMSFFGVLFLVAIISGIVSIAIKIIPPWLDFLTVSSAVRSVLDQPRMGLQNTEDILKKVDTQLSINNIRIKDLGKNAVVVVREEGSVQVVIDYTVEKPVFAGDDTKITITMHFAKTHEVSSRD